ncbi:hypothetical protein ACFLTZ_04290 [Chloroflexota bacterium]
MKKKLLLGSMVVIALVALVAGYGPGMATPAVAQSSEPEVYPSVVASPVLVPINKKSTIMVCGAGFPAGQELEFIMPMPISEPVLTRLSYELDNPVTSEMGTFTAEWTLGRLSRILEPGVYPLMVSVNDEMTTVVVPVVFYEEE